MGFLLNPLTGQLDYVGSGSSAVTSVNGQVGAVVLDSADIAYDNTSSGLTTTDAQAAIDEVVSSLPTNPYSLTFNATTDWGSASGGYYTITISEATHLKGINPTIQVYETSGSDFISVFPDRILISNAGQVEFRVPDSPDLRFAGKVIISKF